MWQQHAPCGLLEHTAAIFILATIYSSGAVLYYVNTYFEVMVVNVVVIVVLAVREVESRGS